MAFIYGEVQVNHTCGIPNNFLAATFFYTNDKEKFKQFEELADDETEDAFTLRGLLEFDYVEKDQFQLKMWSLQGNC